MAVIAFVLFFNTSKRTNHKMGLLKSFSLLVLLLGVSEVTKAIDIVTCYYGTWAVYRPENGRFAIEDIDPLLCDHLIYTFVGLDETGHIRLIDRELDINQNGFLRFNALKTQNPRLKTFLAIGGWNEGSETYSHVVASSAKRNILIQDAVYYLQTYGFDGFDFDWEYPGQRGGEGEDKENYDALLREFRAEFDRQGLLFTAAVASVPSSVDISYDVPVLMENLDYVHIMTYDIHGSWDNVTGGNAPLHGASTDADPNFNVEGSINGWLERGGDPNKMIMGVVTYGRSFTLESAANAVVGAPTIGPGELGPYTREEGFLGYYEICNFINQGWNTGWNDVQKFPYAWNGDQWVSYDNEDSIILKVEFAKSKNLKGIMVWSVETDDFNSLCGSRNPILRAINNNR